MNAPAYTRQLRHALEVAQRSEDIGHLAAVAMMAPDEESHLVSWLHDSIEDGYASEDELRQWFPAQVADAVVVLTRQDGERYQDYIWRVRESKDALALVVKRNDLIANLARARRDRRSLVRRYERALAVLG